MVSKMYKEMYSRWLAANLDDPDLKPEENAVAMISGCICDGAKASCAAKIAMSVDCGLLGYDMYAGGNNFQPGHGILGTDVEDTIHHVGVLAAEGMKETDRVILRIMTE